MASEWHNPDRQLVLWWEFCCLLHDIGKLSETFLHYRQTWHTLEKGYGERDPHDHEWLDKDPLLKEAEFAPLNDFFRDEIIPARANYGKVSVENAVHNHIRRKQVTQDLLCRVLAAGDGIDSKWDRNNPLVGCEQTVHERGLVGDELEKKLPDMYRGNVFGWERRVDRAGMEKARRTFYLELQHELRLKDGRPAPNWPDNEEAYGRFQRIRKSMKTCWDEAMSDTTRPDNDTSLWEHVYSVSSIAKALLVRLLVLNKTTMDGERGYFHLWGFGFDTLRFLSSAHKIGDVLGRRKVVQDIFNEAVQMVEYSLACGNCVYRDENCVFFLVPDLEKTFSMKVMLKEKAQALCAQISRAELEAKFQCTKEPTEDLTKLAELIDGLRTAVEVPFTGSPDEFVAGVKEAHPYVGKPESICPVCRMRPVFGAEKEVCEKCRRRRMEGAATRDKEQTAFLTEVEDDTGRVALVVARIGLHHWLNGNMVRTMFVTEPHGIRKTLKALDAFVDLPPAGNPYYDAEFWKWRDERLKMGDDFAAMKAEFPTVRYGGLIYGRGLGIVRGQDRWMEARREWVTEDLSRLCAKSTTPSTILDVWETAEEFFKHIPKLLAQILAKRPRKWIEVNRELEGLHENEAAEGTIDGVGVEVVRKDGRRLWLLGRKGPEGGNTLRLDARDYTITRAGDAKEVAYPWREVLTSPNLFMALVPADQALELTSRIDAEWRVWFGKVRGRLPLAVAHLFFPSHLPMFSVLDAARRVERRFRNLQSRAAPEVVYEGPGSPNDLLLGAGVSERQTDFHHPYLPLAASDHGGCDFETLNGRLVHMGNAKGRRVLAYPDLYYSAWIGSSAQRFEVEAPTGGTPGRGRGRQPIELAELERRVTGLWKQLRANGISDTTMRGIAQVFFGKSEAWKAQDAEGNAARRLALAMARDLPPALLPELERAMKDGTFERTLELYWHILKQRLQEKTKDAD